MKVAVEIQYPSQSTATICVPSHIIKSGPKGTMKFAFDEKSTGMRTLDTFKDNIEYMMIALGYMSNNGKVLSVEISE